MADQSASLRDWTTIGLGALAAVIGFYYLLVGFGLAPAAPAPKGEANAPNCIGLLVGLVFSAGGLAVTLRGAIAADRQSSELPAGAPKWVAAVYWRLGLLVASGLAATATWVAFGGGTRPFNMMGLIAGPVDDTAGRIAFGIGAIISWLIVAAMARTTAKNIFGKKTNASSGP